MNPIEGTEILFFKDGQWWNKDFLGNVTLTSTYEYHLRYLKKDSLVVVEGEDDEYISNLNGGAFTIVVDKDKISRPNLKTEKFTKEWMSLSHYLALRKMTDKFCIMSKGFYIPTKK